MHNHLIQLPHDPVSIAAVIKAAFFPVVFDDIVVGIGFLATLGVTLFLYATGKTVPEALYGICGIFIGYYIRNMVAAGKSATTDQTNIAPPSNQG